MGANQSDLFENGYILVYSKLRKHHGTMYYENGDKLECNWSGNAAYGRGIKTFANGDVLECIWEGGVAMGEGVKKYANGDKLICDWANDKANGPAYYISPVVIALNALGLMIRLIVRVLKRLLVATNLNALGLIMLPMVRELKHAPVALK